MKLLYGRFLNFPEKILPSQTVSKATIFLKAGLLDTLHLFRVSAPILTPYDVISI